MKMTLDVYKRQVLDLDKNSLPRFDLILLDIMMPDVDGLQFCHEIRNQVDCPILFITAKTQEAVIVQGLSYRCVYESDSTVFTIILLKLIVNKI